MSEKFSVNRRSFLQLAAMACATPFALSACSSSEGNQISGPTRKITDIQKTEVDIPENPQRIVALSEPTLDGLLALGIKPVGAVAGRGQRNISDYLLPRTEGVELLGNVGQPNFEAIGAAKPDLILVDGTSVNNNQPVIDALRKIGPVVYTGFGGGDWKVNFRYIAESVNKQDEGEQIIKDYEARVEEVKAGLSDYASSTFSVVRWQGNNAALILKELPAGLALTDLGLNRPPNQDHKGRGHSEPVSLENLKDIDADYMFFGTLGGSSISNPDAGGGTGIADAQKAIQEAEAVPGFTSLKAYKENNIIPVDGAVWTSTGGPILMNHIIDDVQAALG